jgi:diazepam-binding inhibitor (GABA receptor modulating acyl-CoA-binding protein)
MPSTAYEVAKVESKLLLAAPSQNEMLEARLHPLLRSHLTPPQLYGLAKVAEDIDIKSRAAPGMFDFAVSSALGSFCETPRPWRGGQEKEKRKAWQKLLDEKVTPEQAEARYIALVADLKEKYGEKTDLSDKEKKELEDAKAKGTDAE